MNIQSYSVAFKFNASHSIRRGGRAAHAHTFLCKLSITKNIEGYHPFYEYEKMLSSYFDNYRSKFINNCEAFQDIVPTLENMAGKFYIDISRILSDQTYYSLRSLELGDSPLNSVIVAETYAFDGTGCNYKQEEFKKVLDYRKTGIVQEEE